MTRHVKSMRAREGVAFWGETSCHGNSDTQRAWLLPITWPQVYKCLCNHKQFPTGGSTEPAHIMHLLTGQL